MRTSAGYDSKSQSLRASVASSSENPYQGFQLNGNVEQAPRQFSGGAGVRYIHPLFEAGTQQDTVRNSGGSRWESSAHYSLASAIVWADGIVGLSRPVQNSFLLLKADSDGGEKGPILVNQGVQGSEARMRGRWPAVLSQVGPYTHKQVQLGYDGIGMEQRLEPQRFELGPMSYQGVLQRIQVVKNIMLRGRLVRGDGGPVALQKITLKHAKRGFETFTNRKGGFFLEEAEAGRYYVEFEEDGIPKVLEFEVPQDVAGGLHELGTLQSESNE